MLSDFITPVWKELIITELDDGDILSTLPPDTLRLRKMPGTNNIAYDDFNGDTKQLLAAGGTDPVPFTSLILTGQEEYLLRARTSLGGSDLLIVDGKAEETIITKKFIAKDADNNAFFTLDGNTKIIRHDGQLIVDLDSTSAFCVKDNNAEDVFCVNTIDGKTTIYGDLEVLGNITYNSQETIEIKEPLISLATGNATDNVDIGFFGEYTSAGTRYTGLVRDATTKSWRLFSGIGVKPTDTVNFVGASDDNLRVGELTATSLALSVSATIGNTLNVVGATTLSSLGVTSNATVGGTLGVTGASTLASLGVTANATVGGTLGVTGLSTLASLGVTSNATVGGTLGVTGATTLSSLGVTSNATVGGTLGVTSNATVGGTLGVTSNATVGGTLGVTGATTLSTLAVVKPTAGDITYLGANGDNVHVTNYSGGVMGDFVYPNDRHTWIAGANTRIRTENKNLIHHETLTRITKNGEPLQVVGTDHSIIGFYPDGTAAGRKGLVGFSTALDDNMRLQVAGTSQDIRFEIEWNAKARVHNTGMDVNGVLAVNANGEVYQLIGTDHCYMGFYPDGISARKAYIGIPNADTKDFNIVSEESGGPINLVIAGGNYLSLGSSGVFIDNYTSNDVLYLKRNGINLIRWDGNSTSGFASQSCDCDVFNVYRGDLIRQETKDNTTVLNDFGVGGPPKQLAIGRFTNEGGTDWSGLCHFGSDAGDNVMIGNYNGMAAVGAHVGALNGWADLFLNHGGGNVKIGGGNTRVAPTARLEVVGDIKSTGNATIGSNLTVSNDVQGVTSTLNVTAGLPNATGSNSNISVLNLSVKNAGNATRTTEIKTIYDDVFGTMASEITSPSAMYFYVAGATGRFKAIEAKNSGSVLIPALSSTNFVAGNLQSTSSTTLASDTYTVDYTGAITQTGQITLTKINGIVFVHFLGLVEQKSTNGPDMHVHATPRVPLASKYVPSAERRFIRDTLSYVYVETIGRFTFIPGLDPSETFFHPSYFGISAQVCSYVP